MCFCGFGNNSVGQNKIGKADDIAHNCNGLAFEWEKSGIIQCTCGLSSFR